MTAQSSSFISSYMIEMEFSSTAHKSHMISSFLIMFCSIVHELYGFPSTFITLCSNLKIDGNKNNYADDEVMIIECEKNVLKF